MINIPSSCRHQQHGAARSMTKGFHPGDASGRRTPGKGGRPANIYNECKQNPVGMSHEPRRTIRVYNSL
jgi:hypothetical protein